MIKYNEIESNENTFFAFDYGMAYLIYTAAHIAFSKKKKIVVSVVLCYLRMRMCINFFMMLDIIHVQLIHSDSTAIIRGK